MRQRPRRLRQSTHLRELVSETSLSLKKLIQPYFVVENPKAVEPIRAFTGINRYGLDPLSSKIELDMERGVRSFLLFGEVPQGRKDDAGSAGYGREALIPHVVKSLKSRFGADCTLFTDVCLCPATSHGHCGVVKEGRVENDPSLELLGKMALAHAQGGADFVAPSDMMDGRVGFIRDLLDEKGFSEVGILAYTAKFSSSYYGPFREALGSAPKGTDRATYQMDFRNRKESLRELELDLNEGADMVMVKPALAYLDVIAEFKRQSPVPVVAYSVGGEYEMVKQMAARGLADERKMTIENLTAIQRAGADVIITYSASELAEKGWTK